MHGNFVSTPGWRTWGLGFYFLVGGHLQPCGQSGTYMYFNLCKCPSRDVWTIILSFWVWGYMWLCAACWVHFMCHHKLWLTSVTHPFPLSIALKALLEKNITRKLPSLSLDVFLKNLLFQFFFPYILCHPIISHQLLKSILSSSWFVIAVCGSISAQATIVKW